MMTYLFATCRKNLHSTSGFAKRVEVINPDTLEILGPGSIKQVPTLVFVHGYRGTWDSVSEGYRETFEMFRGLDDVFPYQQVIGFYWPGSWAAILGYLKAEWRSNEAGRALKELCELVGSAEYTLSGHSLGCRVISEAMLYGAKPNHVIYIGAAVTANSYEPGERYADNRAVPHTILHSKNDPVLRRAFRWAHLGAWALGCVGLHNNGGNRENKFLHALDVSETVHRHSGYRTCREYYQALRGPRMRP